MSQIDTRNARNEPWDLEEVLLTDQFYSSHTPDLPKKTEPEKVPVTDNLRRTSFMTASPSMKALDSMLTLSKKPPLNSVHDIVEEEEEDEDEQPPNGHLSTIPMKHNTQSVQSFETAKLFSSPHKSVKTMDSMPSDQSTPVVEDVTFHAIETPILVQNVFNPNSPLSSTPLTNSARSGSPDSQSTSANSLSVLQKYSKLIAPPSQRKLADLTKPLILRELSPVKIPLPLSQHYVNASTDSLGLPEHTVSLDLHSEDSLSVTNLSANNLSRENLTRHNLSRENLNRENLKKLDSLNNSEFLKNSPNTSTPPFRSLLTPGLPAEQNTQKLSASASSNKIPGSTFSKLTASKSLPSFQLQPAVELHAPKPTPPPQVRSSSTFNFQLKDVPKHKKSSTLSDLTKIEPPRTPKGPVRKAPPKTNTPPPQPKSPPRSPPPEKRRFSFKSLFKSKSKSHSLNEPKMALKSYSTSNLQTLTDQNKARNAGAATSNKSFINVFKRIKSSDNLSAIPTPTNKNDLSRQTTNSSISYTSESTALSTPSAVPTPSVSVRQPTTTLLAEMERKRSTKNTTFKSNTAINLIREVNDDDYDPNTVKQKGTDDSSVASEDEDFYDEYDESNLHDNPPQKLSNARYDEEIFLSNPNRDIETEFGLPFQVKYDMPSPAGSPSKPMLSTLLRTPLRIPAVNDFSAGNSPVLSITPTVNITPPAPINSPGNLSVRVDRDELLGDALFPKSLSAQEVESIVSLERLRLMKSIKLKRNSFINYNGSDENIIQFQGSPSSAVGTGMKRSNSILKNSISRRDLADELYPSIDARTDEPNEIAVPELDRIDVSSDVPSKLTPTASASETEEESPISPIPNGLESAEQNDVTTLAPKDLARLSTENYDLFNNDTTVVDDNHYNQYNLPEFNDFSEFSEFIDVDNLSFSSPKLPSISKFPERVPSLVVVPPLLFELPDMKTKMSQPPVGAQEVTGLAKEPETNGSVLSSTKEYEDSVASPILVSAYRTLVVERSPQAGLSPDISGNLSRSRPISMSFRGLKGPSFGGKLSNGVAPSDSHQSFNLSFEESDGGAGGGYGTDDDEEEYRSSRTSDEIHYSRDYKSDNERSPDSRGFSGFHEAEISETRSRGLPVKPQTSFSPPPAVRHDVSDYHGHKRSGSDAASVNSASSLKSFSLLISKWKKPLKNSPETQPKSSTTRTVHPIKFLQSQQLLMGLQPTSPTGVRFSSRIILYDTYNCDEYDRHPDTATCNQLTPILAQQIKEELNSFKSEMSIHILSRCYTHFF